MRIGITYDLKASYLAAGYTEEQAAEFDSEETINAIAESLQESGYRPVFIGNLFSLTKQLACHQTWDMVFNIAEGLSGRNREAQIPCLLEAYQIPYTFSDPLTLSIGLDKSMSKRLLRDAGIATPAFQVIDQPGSSIDTSALDFPRYPLFVKPLQEGTGKGITAASVVTTPQELESAVHHVHSHYHQPVLIESYLPGQEYTVGVLGTGMDARVLGVLEINYIGNQETSVYSFQNKKHYQERLTYQLAKQADIVDQASRIALAAYQTLQCRDAGRVDLRTDSQGRIQVIEINPLAGLHPVDSDLPILCRLGGISYLELIQGIIASAQKRYPDLNKTKSKINPKPSKAKS